MHFNNSRGDSFVCIVARWHGDRTDCFVHVKGPIYLTCVGKPRTEGKEGGRRLATRKHYKGKGATRGLFEIHCGSYFDPWAFCEHNHLHFFLQLLFVIVVGQCST